MPPIVLTIEIARPPDEVFSYVTDPSRFSEWQEDAARGRVEGGGPPGVGSRFTTTRRIGRAERTTTSEITEINPPRSWAAHGVDGPIRPIMHVTVAPLGEQRTVARHDRRRLRGPRDRQTARAPRPLVGTQGRSHELSEPQGTARGRRLARLMLLTPQCDRAARACLR